MKLITMHRSEFLKLLKERLPDLRMPVNQHKGLLHFEMDVLRKFAQRAIFEGDRSSLQTCLKAIKSLGTLSIFHLSNRSISSRPITRLSGLGR
jgi:hypothetical protein